jgi:hypothetical protein
VPPPPAAGLLVLGENVVAYVGPGKAPPRSASLRPCVVKAWGHIDVDGSRVLMSDSLVGGWVAYIHGPSTAGHIRVLPYHLPGGGTVHAEHCSRVLGF